ncbi:MAG: AAA family ATPase [Clostridia bacterium]|nr:AAA family ATPase [Clostridia bacterium]
MKGIGIGIGISDFKALRIRDNYFIDKTTYIKDIIDNQAGVVLVTRPRRFGKTLNMSMLRYYFDCTKKDTKELFKGLKIMEQEEKYTSKQGYYPCIYMTLKDVRGSNYEEMMMCFETELNELFIDHANLLQSEKLLDIEKEMFSTILNLKANKVQMQSAVKLLSKLLNKEYGKPVILFLDEYDVPLQNAYVEGFYDETIKFFKTFYGTTFKDNPYLEKTVITGVSRVAKESIFSGANNFDVYTVLDDEFSDDFGITREEMKKIIKDFEVEEDEEEIKKWYDGYTIGNTEGIYNPWSVLNYLAKRKLVPYWVNTSSNDLIRLILKKSVTVKEKMERLLKDEAIEVKVDQETVIVGIEENEENIWGLLVGTGYLKVVETVNLAERIYKVKLPNKEIRELFRSIVRDWFRDKVIGNDLSSILKDLVTLNLEEFEEKFQILVMQMFSYMDVGENTAENFYHAFALGMLVGLKDSYYVNSNRESGMGRYDIMLEPKDKNGNAFIMEFKVFKQNKEKDIEETIENAKKQIEEKRYEENLRERGYNNITKLVFAFNGKEVKMEVYNK